MAYTQEAAQQVVEDGLNPSYTAPSGAGAGNGDSVPGDGKTFLLVQNGGASPITVTVITGRTARGHDIADQTVSVPNAEERFIGPFDTAIYNQPGSHPTDANRVLVEYSDITSVTRAVLTV